MTAKSKGQVKSNRTLSDKIKAVNQMLKDSEPTSVSVDSYSGYSGYKPQYVIDCLNKEVGIDGWGFEEIKTATLKDKSNLPYLALAQVKVWLKDVRFQPVAWGQSRITRDDIGDAKKGAQTDAIKKALSYFSIGNRAYHGLLGNGKGKS